MPLIKAENLTKIYQMEKIEVKALEQIDLVIQKGEFASIMGPSGSGKSTLMHLLGCLDRPTSGRLYLDERNISALSDEELSQLRNSKIGFVFQSFHLLPRSSALENVELPLLYAQKPKAERAERAIALLQKVGLGHRLNHKPNELSGGEKQRVAIARALANNPVLLLADEPTGNLDSKAGEEIMRALAQLNKQGVTLLVVTHDPLIASHAERTIHIRDGRILKEEVRSCS